MIKFSSRDQTKFDTVWATVSHLCKVQGSFFERNALFGSHKNGPLYVNGVIMESFSKKLK